jgi:hypothetical protein
MQAIMRQPAHRKRRELAMNIFERLRNLFRRSGQVNPMPDPTGPDPHIGTAPGPDPAPFQIPPGMRPIIIKTEQANIPGPQPLSFRRREVILRDAQNAKYSMLEVTRQILPGCSHVVDGPSHVGGISDITGRYICDKCIRPCHLCGRQTAPTERIPSPQGKYLFMCIICQAEVQKKERRAAFWHFILGPFIS